MARYTVAPPESQDRDGYVKTYWSEKLTKADREERYTTTYPIYLNSVGLLVGSLDGEHAPRSLEEAEHILKSLVESPNNEWTYGIIYEQRAVARYGTEYRQYKKPTTPRSAR